MEQVRLSETATLRELTGSLDNAEEFVRRVLEVMWAEHKAHGEIIMRLGITGKGIRPNYRFEPAGGGDPIVAIDGNSHGHWDPAAVFDGRETWSRATMTLKDVQILRQELNMARR
jgi:hypothetical protein